MNFIQKIGVVVSLLLPFFVGCTSHPNHTGILAVEVAGYKESDEATAGKLTFVILHQHGIEAGGYGKGGYVHVAVPPSQVAQAHKILQEELSGLSQKEKDSFQIVWQWQKGNPNGLDFLGDIPSLKAISLKMSEAEFLDILHQQKLDYKQEGTAGQSTYWVKPKVHVIVVFGFQEGHCSGIQRLPD